MELWSKAGNDFRGNTYYLTASDVEDCVRRFLYDDLKGQPRGTSGWGYGNGVRVSGNLNATVRDWLLSNPKLAWHNSGRGHISGARFRPVGEPISPAEEATKETKAKDAERSKLRREGKLAPKPVHFSKNYGGPLCTASRRSPFSYSNHRSSARRTSVLANVTCPRCLKLLAEKK